MGYTNNADEFQRAMNNIDIQKLFNESQKKYAQFLMDCMTESEAEEYAKKVIATAMQVR